jgi:E3 ubiquitin-protein ligase UBR4
LPIWGPDVTETLFSNALARHNNYLLEATGIRDSSYILSIHDLKLLIIKFAENLSFSEESGGGGRESNINLLPYMIHAILYSVNTAKYVSREEKNMKNFLEASEKLVSNSFECDNAFYYLAMALVIMKPAEWAQQKVKYLQRLLLTVHTRLVNVPSLEKQKLASCTIQEFKKYKPALLFIGLVNLIFKNVNQKCQADSSETSSPVWTEKFATYIRHNDIGLMDACRKILKEFEEDLMVCEDWVEMFDVLGFLEEISEPVEFLRTYLSTFAK